jgi:hypothetical protein
MTQQKIARAGLAVLGLAVAVSFLITNEASAKGCNGVVNQMEWGCAAWDNNNGPQFPHYNKPASAQPAAKTALAVPAPSAAAVQPRAGAPIISTNGSGIVASGAGNAVPKSGIVASGAGNAVKKDK